MEEEYKIVYEIADIYTEPDVDSAVEEDADAKMIKFVRDHFDLKNCVNKTIYLKNIWFENEPANLAIFFREADTIVLEKEKRRTHFIVLELKLYD